MEEEAIENIVLSKMVLHCAYQWSHVWTLSTLKEDRPMSCRTGLCVLLSRFTCACCSHHSKKEPVSF